MPIPRYRRPRKVDYNRPDWADQAAELAGTKKKKRAYRTYTSMNDIATLHARQRGRCANLACLEIIPPFGRGRAMDHDPSGKAHGMLCKACSLGLGLFKRDPVRLRGAAEYLAACESNKVSK